MPSSINKTTALAVIGILFASFSQSVCLAEAPTTRKRHLRSASAGTRILDDRDKPSSPQREFELEDFKEQPDSKEAKPEVGAEAPVNDPKDVVDTTKSATKDVKVAEEPNYEVGAEGELTDKDPKDVVDTKATKDVKVAEEPNYEVGAEGELTVKDSKDVVDTTKATKDVKPEVGAEKKEVKPEVGDEEKVKDDNKDKDDDKKPKPDDQIAVGEEIEELVDDASFVIKGHPKKTCAWLSGKKDGAIRKWCRGRAFKNKVEGEKPKVYQFCTATCCAAGLGLACPDK